MNKQTQTKKPYKKKTYYKKPNNNWKQYKNTNKYFDVRVLKLFFSAQMIVVYRCDTKSVI